MAEILTDNRHLYPPPPSPHPDPHNDMNGFISAYLLSIECMAFHLLEVFVDHALYLLDLDACLRESVYLARNYEANVRVKKIGDAMVFRVEGCWIQQKTRRERPRNFESPRSSNTISRVVQYF